MQTKLVCPIMAVVVIIAVPEFSAAQQRPEYLRLTNDCAEPIRLYIRALHPNSPTHDWQGPAYIEPNKTGELRLHGYQPFDVLIRRADDTVIKLPRKNLCSVMEDFRRTGWWRWQFTGYCGAIVQREHGNVIELDPGRPVKLSGRADSNSVNLFYGGRKLCVCRVVGKEYGKELEEPIPPESDDGGNDDESDSDN